MTVRRFAPVFLLLLLLSAANAVYAVSPNIVISQVYGGAGCGTAGCSTYKNDYIELFNRGASSVSVAGWSVQYASSAGTTWQVTNLSGTIPAGGYLLVQEGAGANGLSNIPTPDVTGTIAMSATTAKVALVNSTTALSGQCGNGAATTLPASVVDFVGYGTSANCNDGGGTTGGAGNAPAPSTTNADFRAANGCTDTDSNSSDFSAAAAAPRNSATALAPCGVSLPNLTINDVSLAEGNAGTTTFTFTVSLSSPAGAGGVTFDIATADGTAQDDNPAAEDNDYVAQSLTSQTITSGNSSYSFNVTVNGDVIPESNETFFVNVTNATGATVTDGQGQGTIQNEDAACANLSINDVTQNETNAGTTTFAFTVSLSQAGCGTVTFDIATQDNTATTADNDYVAQSLTGQTITFPSSYTFNVTVNGDATAEPNQTFFVNLTNVSPGNVQVTDAQGLGTIVNDDFTRIHDIQGNGGTSPLVGNSVTTRGIVTGLKSNGFYIQEPDASVDADPATSEGILVFTSAAPPAGAVLGAYVEVTGTVAEFIPSSDPLQPPLTELTSPTVVQLSTGNPLPAAIPLTATFPDPTGPFDQLERVEGMRVSVASLTTSGPTLGNSTNETNATQTSNGVFFGVVTGVARPAREPGIQAPDPAPSGGSIPPIPRYDTNPETIRVDSDALTGATAIDVTSKATVTGLIGPLEYTFRRYTILPDPGATIGVSGGMTMTAATAPQTDEFTVGSYNVERFFDTVNDPAIGEPVLTATAYNNRLNKVSLGIRNQLNFPDVLGMVEVENLSALQDIATRVNNDAVANAQPNPQYVAYLSEGNDVGGIDVGFLVKTAPVVGATPRVTVNAVVQENAGELFVNPDSSTELLNDRPPLRLDATINHANGATYPVTVIVNHLRSLLGVNVEGTGSNGWATSGARVRAKRQKQAESLANLVQARQTATPSEKIILIGDFNAYEFNDGLADTMDTIAGTPPPDNETAVPGDGTDLVNPDLDNLFDTPPAGERYSYVFDGQMQNIDHEIVNAALIASTTARRVEHPRINTDFPATDRNDPNTPRHLSDHDPIVGYFEVLAFATADLSITKTDNIDPVNAGQNFFYTITVDNAGPDPAANVSWSDTLPASTTFVSLSAPGGWSCTTPAVGATGTVSCSIASLAVTSAAFTLTVAVDPTLASGTLLSNTATVTSTTADPDNADLSDTETTTVATSADLLLSKTDSPDPVNAGSNLSYQITITNNGPSVAANATFSDTLPAGTTFVSLSTTGPWSCSTPAVGASGTVTCTNTGFGVTVDFFTLVVKVDANVAAGTVLSNTATMSSSTSDPNGANNSATATTTVTAAADIQVTKVDSPDPVTAGTNLTYTITVTNAGPSDAATVSLSDTVPFGTTFVSLTSPGGWSCTTPGVGYTGSVSCSIATFPASGVAGFTLVVKLDPSLANGFVISNTATASSTTTDPSPSNNSDTETTTVGTGSADLQMTKADTPISADPVTAGGTVLYTIIIQDLGPSNADNVTWSDTIPAGTTFSSIAGSCAVCSLPPGWSCTTPPAGGTGTVSCTGTSVSTSTNAIFTLILNVDPSLANGTVLSNTATVSADTPDPNSGNNSDTETTTVVTSADVQVTKVDTPDPVTAGTNITYTITVTNAGQSDAQSVALADTIPASTTFVSFTAPGGWSCTTPAAGGTGAINCSIATLAAGSNAVFTLVVAVDPSLTTGTVNSNTATVSSTTTDPNSSNNTATATTTVGIGSSDLSITKVDSPDPVGAGANLTYTITIDNAGPTNASSVSLSDTLPASTTFVSLASPAGWSCITPAVGATGTVTCTNANIGLGSAVFTLVVQVAAATPNGTVLSNTATVSSTTADPNTGNESATATTTVQSLPNVTGTKSVTGTFQPGGAVTYTIVLTNSGTATQPNNPGDEFVDVLPSSLTLVSASATSGTALATIATNTVTWNGSIAPAASVTITINATIKTATPVGTTVSNQGTIHYDADGNGSNEATRPTDNPAQGGASDATPFTVTAESHFETIPTLDEWALMALAAILAAIAVMAMKR